MKYLPTSKYKNQIETKIIEILALSRRILAPPAQIPT